VGELLVDETLIPVVAERPNQLEAIESEPEPTDGAVSSQEEFKMVEEEESKSVCYESPGKHGSEIV
jgi:hypothetical protein